MRAKLRWVYLLMLSISLTVATPLWAGSQAKNIKRITSKIQTLMSAAKMDPDTKYQSGILPTLKGEPVRSLLLKAALLNRYSEYQLDEYINGLENLRARRDGNQLNESDIKSLSGALLREVSSRLSGKTHLFTDELENETVFRRQETFEAKRLIDFLFETLRIPSDLRVRGNDVQFLSGIKLRTLILEAYLNRDISTLNLLSSVRSAMSLDDPKHFGYGTDFDQNKIYETVIPYFKEISTIASGNFIKKFRMADSNPWHSDNNQVELNNSSLSGELHHMPIVNVIGFGSKNQFGSIAEMEAAAKIFVAKWNAQFRGKWMIAYEGDSANPAKPDVGLLVRHIREKYGISVLAIQSDIVKNQWGGVEKWIDYVHYVPTDVTIVTDRKESILWGGTKDGHPVGASKIMFDSSSPLATDSLSSGIAGVGIFGGGEIAKSELGLAENLKIQIDFYPLHAKNPNIGQPFGEVYSAAKKYSAYEVAQPHLSSSTCAELLSEDSRSQPKKSP